jgi:hypothetical protein
LRPETTGRIIDFAGHIGAFADRGRQRTFDMTEYSTLEPDILGPSDLLGPVVAFEQLPDGEIFAVNFVPNTSTSFITQSTFEFLEPGEDSITDVTSSAYSGTIPTDIDSLVNLGLVYIGSSTTPDIIIPNGGYDQYPHDGGLVMILAPDAEGQYVDDTSQLPLEVAFTADVEPGVIDGLTALVVTNAGSEAGRPNGAELVVANPDGSFSNWTSHLPSSVITTGPNDGFGAAAIGDFADPYGDIFLAGSYGDPDVPDTLLVNNGSGYFTAEPIDIPLPTLEGYGTLGQNVLVTQFYGDTHEDLIVDYASVNLNNTSGPNYYIQFLQGNGAGGFTDVTAQHFADQPALESGIGTDDWVQRMQLVEINGYDDLILYLAQGVPEILLNNGEDVFTPSPVQISTGDSVFPTNVSDANWGTDAGVGGFYVFNDDDTWVFYPITSAYLTPTSATLNQPLASRLYLYGNGSGAATAKTLAASFDTVITMSAQIFYTPGVTATVDIIVNGVDLGAEAMPSTYGGSGGGQAYTPNRELKWVLPGVVAIDSLQFDSSVDGLAALDVQIDGVDLGNGDANSTGVGPNMRVMTDLSTWNDAIDPNIGTASDPIAVTGTGTGVTAYVLGAPDQYEVTGIGTSTLHLFESAGLDQNAVLTDVAFIDFQDGSVLNTQTGVATDSAGNPVPISIGAPSKALDDVYGDGRSDVLIQNTGGAVVVGALGAGGQETYAQVAALGPEWTFVGTGDFLGAGVSDFLIENTAGAVDVGEVTGGQAQYTEVAGLGPEWRFVGTGDFVGDGKSDFLIENTSGAVVVGEVVSGQAQYAQVASLGPEWSFVGTGDFLGDGKTDFLIENTAGAVVVGELVSGQAQYTQVAALGPEWKFVETGDFLGDGRSDFLIENTAGAVVVGEVTNGQATYTQVGGLGPEWRFVGAGDYAGTGIDSFLIENTAGAIFTGTVVSGAAQYAQVGALGPEWTFHG